MRRQEALRQLAHVRSETAAASPLPPVAESSPATPRIRSSVRTISVWLLALVVVLVSVGAFAVLVSVGAFAVLRNRALPPTGYGASTQTVRIELPPNDLECPHDASWSPHSPLVAIVGYVGRCPSRADNQYEGDTLYTLAYAGPGDHVPGLVDIYDTNTGRLVAQIHPDDAIRSTIKLSQSILDKLPANIGPENLLGFNYTHILWSPDGQRLAVTFDVYVPTALATQPEAVDPGSTYQGLLLADALGHPLRVLMQPIDRTHPTATEWDLSTGQAVKSPLTASAASPFATVPAALGYHWNADGTLVPDPPLSAAGSPATPGAPGAIGEPDGGQSFSIWQPGELSATVLPPPGLSNTPPLAGAYTWSADIAAWSPDGRYLIERIDLRCLLSAAGIQPPAPHALQTYGWEAAPQLAARDAGMAQAAQLASTSSFVPDLFVQGVLVAWRPDGRVVAVDAQTAQHGVYLYDAASGKQLAYLKPGPGRRIGGGYVEGEPNLLRWSPDGRRLLLLDMTLGTITIWGQAELL
ncbi:MAG TPA: hypothetical protein VFU88_16665 [Ktedonobacterales bacterium]|nr:hypothetical protein [Ktedonobacterales bacterium]